jgi:hypothetical protein
MWMQVQPAMAIFFWTILPFSILKELLLDVLAVEVLHQLVLAAAVVALQVPVALHLPILTMDRMLR